MKPGRKAPLGQPPKVTDLNAFRYKTAVLSAYDRIQRTIDRADRESRAEVERKARESL